MNNERLAMDFWGRVEIAQREIGISSLKQLCKNANIPYQTVANQKSCARLPNLSTAIRLARQLGCPLEWLVMGGNEEPTYTTDNLCRIIGQNERLQAIAEKIVNASQPELFALEVFLDIRK